MKGLVRNDKHTSIFHSIDMSKLPKTVTYEFHELNIFNMGGELVKDFKIKDVNETKYYHDRFDLILDRFLEIQTHNFHVFSNLDLGCILESASSHGSYHHDSIISDKKMFKVIGKYRDAVKEDCIVKVAPFRKLKFMSFHEEEFEVR